MTSKDSFDCPSTGNPPIATDSSLCPETFDLGAPVQDACVPHPRRLNGHELPLSAELVHTLMGHA